MIGDLAMRFIPKRLSALMLAISLIVFTVPARAAANIPVYATVEELAYAMSLLESSGTHTLTYEGVNPTTKLNGNPVLIQVLNMALWTNLKQLSYSQSSRGGAYTLSWSVEDPAAYRTAAEAEAKSAVKSIIHDGMTIRDKYKALHDWLVRRCGYDVNAEYAGQLAWNALVGKRSVCNGYAKAYKLLCETAGLPCMVVMGTADNGEDGYVPHAWNMVPVDGQWRFVDVTWDDPITIKSDNLRYTYFLVTYEQLSADHKPDTLNQGQKADKSLLRLATLFSPDRVDSAEALLALKLIDGTGSGFALTRPVMRVEGATLFTRLMGIASSYNAAIHPLPFSDVADWAVPYVAVLYYNGYTSGIGGGLFGSTDSITLDMYATQLLWALGYSGFVYTQASVKAVEYGLLAQEEVDAIKIRGFLRGDLFMLSQRSLGQRLNNNTETLGRKLGFT